MAMPFVLAIFQVLVLAHLVADTKTDGVIAFPFFR
jgi:hypothetical protein